MCTVSPSWRRSSTSGGARFGQRAERLVERRVGERARPPRPARRRSRCSTRNFTPVAAATTARTSGPKRVAFTGPMPGTASSAVGVLGRARASGAQRAVVEDHEGRDVGGPGRAARHCLRASNRGRSSAARSSRPALAARRGPQLVALARRCVRRQSSTLVAGARARRARARPRRGTATATGSTCARRTCAARPTSSAAPARPG